MALEFGYLLRIEKFLERIRFLRVPKVPHTLSVELTNICNLNCTMCPRDKLTRKLGYMDFQLFKKIIDETGKLNIQKLHLNRYGESLLHPEIFEMIKYAKEKGFENVGFTTNGLLLDEKKTIEALESGLDYITFSIDSLNKENYEKIRVGGKFETAIENVNRLIDLKKSGGFKKPYITITAINMEPTKDEIEKIRDYWKKRGVDNIIHPYTTYGGLLNNRSVDQRNIKIHACEQPWKRLVVMWEGSVTVCCLDFNCKLKIGDINKESIIDIWNGEELKRLRKVHINHEFEKLPSCNQCDYIKR